MAEVKCSKCGGETNEKDGVCRVCKVNAEMAAKFPADSDKGGPEAGGDTTNAPPEMFTPEAKEGGREKMATKGQFPCTKCDKVCRSERFLDIHMKRMHGVEKKKTPETPKPPEKKKVRGWHKPCSVEGCTKYARIKGMCIAHSKGVPGKAGSKKDLRVVETPDGGLRITLEGELAHDLRRIGCIFGMTGEQVALMIIEKAVAA